MWAGHATAEWRRGATSAGPTMLARIGVMRALNRHVERPTAKEYYLGVRNDGSRYPPN